MNLTYAEQRALEIGITIAGGADVILLDEPTAGMSKSETARFVELIREVTVGKTLLTVEHDMGVVFGLADKIAVLVYGEVIAFDVPEEVRANARGAGGLPRLGARRRAGRARARATDMLQLTDLHAYYGKSHILHGVDMHGGRGRDRQPARPQRLGPLDHGQDDHGPGGAARARSRFRGEEILGHKAFEIAHRGIGYVPENRDIFPKLTVSQNLLLGEKRGRRSRRAGRSTTCTRCSRA